jgi:hypothetical protein
MLDGYLHCLDWEEIIILTPNGEQPKKIKVRRPEKIKTGAIQIFSTYQVVLVSMIFP